MASSRPRLAAAAIALAAAAGGALWALRPAPPPPPPSAAPTAAPSPAPEPAPSPALLVMAVTGTVDAGGPDGRWRPLAAGEVLRADGLVRTGPGASAELAAGTASRLAIGERTQLGVRELSAAVHRFKLTRGLIKVDYEPDGDRVVRIEEAGGGAVAEARAASFHVAASGLAFAVASRTGTVSLSAAGRTVAVGAGEAALSAAGAAPSAPRPIPTDLLLKVAEASRVGPASHCLDSSGRSEPGALVTVDGEPVEVDVDGTFPLRVPRRPGLAQVEVRAVSPDGRVVSRTVPCRAEPGADIHDLRVRWKNAGP